MLYYRGRWKLNDSDEFGGWWYQAKSSTDNLLDCRFKPDAGAKGRPDLEFEGGGWEAEAVAALPSPLWLACDRGHIECVRLLLEKGSDTDVSNRSRQTPLFVACRSGHAECAQLLLERGADPNALDDNGRSPLMAACVGHSVISPAPMTKLGFATLPPTVLGQAVPAMVFIASTKG